MERPFKRSYWVSQGNFLAGLYPGSTDVGQTESNMQAILSLGIRCFINLMEPLERDRRGNLFKPYEFVLNACAAELGVKVSYHNLPIKDVSVPTKKQMRKILDLINDSIEDKQPVYLHCRGGIGRTGTVVGCWLMENIRADKDNVLQIIEMLRKDDIANHIPSPETPEQIEFVIEWINTI